jgi:hypothetical protein
VPFYSRSRLKSEFAWCNRSFETDADSWVEFGEDLTAARDAVGAELLRQRDSNAMLVVGAPSDETGAESSRCFWQLTSAPDGTLFLLLMDPGALSPSARNVSLRLGGGAPPNAHFHVFDQLGSQTKPLGTLGHGDAETVAVGIPAGSARILTLQAM